MSDENIAFIDFAPIKNCQNDDSYGEVCMQCNKCGRFKGNEIEEEKDRIKNVIGKSIDIFLKEKGI